MKRIAVILLVSALLISCKQNENSPVDHLVKEYVAKNNIPDGLLRSSVKELAHFLSAYMDGGKYRSASILKKSTIDKMLSLQLEGDKSQGLCWRKSEFESLWGHGGSDPGISTNMFFSPDKKIGIIIFQNSNNGNLNELMEKIFSLGTKD